MLTPALVVEKPGDPFEYQQVELDEFLRNDEVRVKLVATSICHTDLNFGKEESMPELFPAILGHEGAGVVESIGAEVTMVEVGDHVICCYSCCGECRFCQRKETSYCDLWFQYNFGVGRSDGSKAFRSRKTGQRITSHFFGQSSFSKYTVMKETGCVKVAKELSLDMLAPLGCEFMTGAGAMLNILQPDPGMSIAVIGVGAIGLAAVMACSLLQRRPRRIIAVDPVPSRLAAARELDATHGVNLQVQTDLMKVLMDITDGQGVDGAIDTTGQPDVIKSLVHSSARKGKIVSVGVGQVSVVFRSGKPVPDTRKLSSETSMNIFEVVNAGCSYIGCNQGNCYPQEFLPVLIEANQRGLFPYHGLVTQYAARDVEQAVSDIKSGKTVKAVLLWN